jgi:hypothetical protein
LQLNAALAKPHYHRPEYASSAKPTAISCTPPPANKHKELTRHHPPTYSHSVDPLDVDDWLKTINKVLNITQCNNSEKVLYVSGRLEGAAADWWDAYTTAHAVVDTIT